MVKKTRLYIIMKRPPEGINDAIWAKLPKNKPKLKSCLRLGWPSNQFLYLINISLDFKYYSNSRFFKYVLNQSKFILTVLIEF